MVSEVMKSEEKQRCFLLTLFIADGFPEWPAYSIEEPVNLVLNATEDALSVHLEPDTWREEAIALWETHEIELQYMANWRL